MVATDGVGEPTPAFSGLRTTSVVPIIVQQLNFAEWPQFCDHSVTSADVRLERRLSSCKGYNGRVGLPTLGGATSYILRPSGIRCLARAAQRHLDTQGGTSRTRFDLRLSVQVIDALPDPRQTNTAFGVGCAPPIQHLRGNPTAVIPYVHDDRVRASCQSDIDRRGSRMTVYIDEAFLNPQPRNRTPGRCKAGNIHT